MWKFLKFDGAKRGDPEGLVTLPPAGHEHSDLHHTAKRRELVRVVLRDVLRKHGIPTDWIGFEIAPLTPSAGGDAYLVHLLVMRWHEHLMDFAPALQEQLWLGLGRFATDTDRSQFTLGWKFAPDCGCPFDTMPEPAFWSSKNGAPGGAAQAQSPRKFDLPASAYDHRSSGFAPTQPGDLS